MKKQPLFINVINILAVLVLIITLCACQPAGSSSSASGNESSGKPSGGFDLPDPSVGLDQLAGYTQTLTISTTGTLNGESYESIQTVERTSIGGNEILSISESTTGNAPVDLKYAQMNGYEYSMDGENSPCRAAPLENESSPLTDPSSRLPAIAGAAEMGNEEINGISSLHYSFDEKSVTRQSGKNDHAVGELWMADKNAYLVKYELTADIQSDTFIGTRAWSYELTPTAEGETLQLPEFCQPVLADLPTLPNPADTVVQPGFQQYTTDASRSEAVQFYNSSLSVQGWQALPGSKPEEMDLNADIQTMAFTSETDSGGTLLVIRVEEKDGRLQITAQTVALNQLLQVDSNETAAAPEIESTSPVEETAILPDDLPVYPGASILSQTDTFILIETVDSAGDAASFYKDGMGEIGWTLENEMNQSGMIIQSWTNAGNRIVFTITENQGKTQIMISAE